MSSRQRVVIGKVVRAFGTKGEIKVRPFTESLDIFRSLATLVVGDTVFRVLGVRKYRSDVLVALAGVEDSETAKAFSGLVVSTDAESFPAKDGDEYYWFELFGLRVFTVDGRELGAVNQVFRTGAHDVLEIHGPLGEILLPWIEEVISDVDLEAGLLVVDPLEGLVPNA